MCRDVVTPGGGDTCAAAQQPGGRIHGGGPGISFRHIPQWPAPCAQPGAVSLTWAKFHITA